MFDNLKGDVKRIEMYESISEFYEAHDQTELSSFYNWPLEVYDRNEALEGEKEQLKDELKELKQYIEDNQVSDSKEHLRSYYNSRL